MKRISIPKDVAVQRYLRISDGCIYYQLGRNTLRALADKANATRKVGRRVLIDRVILDEYLEKSETEN